MKTAILSVLIAAIASLEAFAGVLAGPVTNAANGHIYYLLTQNSRAASQAEALRLGGDLVTINDAVEQEWVFNTFSITSSTPRGFWIGLDDFGQEGQFTWIGGESASYRNWAPGEPNNAGPTADEDCVFIWALGNSVGVAPGLWNDVADVVSYANFTLHGVVEVDPKTRLSISVATIALEWRSQTNIAYQIQYTTAITNTWINFGSPIDGNGTTNVVFDSAQQSPRRFYRVLTLQ